MLGHRGGAVALAIGDRDVALAGGAQVDVVGAGGGHQNQLQFGAGGQGVRAQAHLVADSHLGALQAFGGLFAGAGVVQDQFAEHLAQWRQVEIAEVEGGVVEEDRAGAVAHQLYLLRMAETGVRLPACPIDSHP